MSVRPHVLQAGQRAVGLLPPAPGDALPPSLSVSIFLSVSLCLSLTLCLCFSLSSLSLSLSLKHTVFSLRYNLTRLDSVHVGRPWLVFIVTPIAKLMYDFSSVHFNSHNGANRHPIRCLLALTVRYLWLLVGSAHYYIHCGEALRRGSTFRFQAAAPFGVDGVTGPHPSPDSHMLAPRAIPWDLASAGMLNHVRGR